MTTSIACIWNVALTWHGRKFGDIKATVIVVSVWLQTIFTAEKPVSGGASLNVTCEENHKYIYINFAQKFKMVIFFLNKMVKKNMFFYLELLIFGTYQVVQWSKALIVSLEF